LPTSSRYKEIKMIKKSSFWTVLFVLVFGTAQMALAQAETATISGTVVDPNNAVVPGATVTAVSTRTGLTRTTTTNQDGFYVLSNIQPSTYEITITSGNFQPYKVTRDVSVAADVTINATLSATTTATVDIQAGSSDIAEINTTDQTVSEVIGNKQLTELPSLSRDPYSFIETLGNVQTVESGGRGVGATINGQRSASTNVLLNGGENVDAFTATAGQRVPIDSVQEYRVTTGTFTAEFGRATGGVVNLITKSGQNRFFGTLYAYNRNSDFASAGFNANALAVRGGPEPRQFFNRNQFGGSLGGPIFKNKLFFFTNTELLRVRSTSNVTVLVPSAASIAAAAPATRAFFAGYTLAARPTGRQQQLAGTGGRVLVFDEVQYTTPADTGAGTPEDAVLSSNRIDWNVSDRVSVYGIYSLDRGTAFEGSVASSPYAGFSTGQTVDNTNIQVASTYSLTSNLVGVSRYTFNKLDRSQPLGEQPAGPTLYLRTSAQRISQTLIALPGYLPFNPGSAIPFGGPQRFHQFAQEFNFNVGNHLLKFGGQYFKIYDNRVFGAYQNSVQTLSLSTNAQAVDNFFDGVIAQFQGAGNPQGRFPGQTLTLPVSSPDFGRRNRYTEFNLYAQDSFKLFPGFTANIGLRYEFFGPQRNEDPNLDSNFYFGGDESVVPANIRSGRVQIAPNSPAGDLWKADKNNFAPSVGFAYDIEGNGKSSLRAGYALRYERNFGNVTFNVIQNPPNYAVVSITPADIGGTPIAITRNNAGPLAGNVGSVTLPRVSLRAVDPNIVNAYAHQYSASYERRFGQVTASAVFSGTSGRKLYSIANINRLGSGTTYLGSTASCPGLATSVDRLNGCYGDINFRGNGGRSDYQSITFSLESGNLFGAGLTMASRYTYSVAKDNLSSTFSESGNQFNLGFLDPFNPQLDYGFADSDVRHRFVTNFVWELPTNRFFTDGLAKAIFGDFTLSGIAIVQSGTPFSVYDCSDAIHVCKYLITNGSPLNFKGKVGADTGNANEFGYLDLRGQTGVNLGAIRANNGGPFPETMTKRNAFRGPGFWDVNLALGKRFFLTERANLQFKVEAYNVFNHANPVINGFGAGVDASGFDPTDPSSTVVTVSKFGRRQLQFAARFTF
jgi:hypothetical protein